MKNSEKLKKWGKCPEQELIPLSAGVTTLADGATQYINGANSLADGTTAYVKGAGQLAAGASQLSGLENLGQVSGGISQLKVQQFPKEVIPPLH